MNPTPPTSAPPTSARGPGSGRRCDASSQCYLEYENNVGVTTITVNYEDQGTSTYDYDEDCSDIHATHFPSSKGDSVTSSHCEAEDSEGRFSY